MNRKTVTWLIIAASLILLGCLIFGGAMTMLKWDFGKLETVKYETNEYQISEAYESISILTDTADVVFVPAENGQTRVVCREQENMKHSVSVRNGVLEIRVEDARKWYQHIGIHWGTPKITVSIPRGQYGALDVKGNTAAVEIPEAFTFESMDIAVTTGSVENHASVSGKLSLRTTTGAVTVHDISVGSLAISVKTGKITASGIRCQGHAELRVTTGKTDLTLFECQSFTSWGSTGGIRMQGLWAEDKLSVERTTGDVQLDRCDAGEIFIKTETGDVTGTLLTEKLFMASTDTGRVKVPKTPTGGQCQVTTDTGDIELSIVD